MRLLDEAPRANFPSRNDPKSPSPRRLVRRRLGSGLSSGFRDRAVTREMGRGGGPRSRSRSRARDRRREERASEFSGGEPVFASLEPLQGWKLLFGRTRHDDAEEQEGANTVSGPSWADEKSKPSCELGESWCVTRIRFRACAQGEESLLQGRQAATWHVALQGSGSLMWACRSPSPVAAY